MASQASQNLQTRSSKAKPSTSAAAATASENNSAVELLLPACNNNNNNNTLARWPLSKYSNFIISQRPGVGTWQERTAGEPHDMWIQITQRRYIQILHGDVLLECINLSEAQGVWKAIRRGPNMLFVVSNSKESSRKFRIRFQPNNQEEPTAVAYACACHLSRFFTLHDADRQGQDDDHPPSCTISIKQLAIAVLDPQNSKWPSDYADIGESPELVPDLLRSCLMDPNFPALVEAVESSLKKLMNSDNSS
ncbi:meiotic recombination protein REC114-like [Daphnia pulicaria]|uniref:meiotic recombination protein REC114-like n=1 Tax=Daphnia pulicaria TaxID=35523 RepID=UPI001EEC8DCE|nr:meiotic recombination protein REC114-like [Daphnia pulicaria]